MPNPRASSAMRIPRGGRVELKHGFVQQRLQVRSPVGVASRPAPMNRERQCGTESGDSRHGSIPAGLQPCQKQPIVAHEQRPAAIAAGRRIAHEILDYPAAVLDTDNQPLVLQQPDDRGGRQGIRKIGQVVEQDRDAQRPADLDRKRLQVVLRVPEEHGHGQEHGPRPGGAGAFAELERLPE